MDYEIVRSVMSVVMLVLFIGIIAWAWSGRQRDRFDAAARLPLEDDLEPIACRIPGEPRT